MFGHTSFFVVMVWACAEGLIVNRQALLVLNKMADVSTTNKANEWFIVPKFTYHDSFYGYEVTYTPRFRSLAGFDMYANATASTNGRNSYIHIPLNVRDLVTEYQVTCQGRETVTFTQKVTTSNLYHGNIKIRVKSSAKACTGRLVDVDVGYYGSPMTAMFDRPAPLTFCYRAVGEHSITALTRHFFGHVRDAAKLFLTIAAQQALKQLNLC